MPSRLSARALDLLARRGLTVRRHPAVRRQAMLGKAGVDLVLDVGAATGGYGTELRRFGYSGRIVSFEPLATAHATLAATCRDDDRWTSRHHALGDENGAAEINVASNSDSSSLLPMAARHQEAAPQVGYDRRETIEVRRLDDVAGELGPGERPFLKLDTQGFERQVLTGGAETVGRCVGLQLELSLVPLYEGGMIVDEAVALAYTLGFRLVGVDPGFADPDGQLLQVDGVFLRA